MNSSPPGPTDSAGSDRWVTVATVDECPAGSTLECIAGDRIVALYNVDGQFFALDGICPHQGGPLGKGRLHGCIVTCPWHGWQFDVRNGQSQIAASIVQPQLAVRVDGVRILVNVP
ncbi:MAG: Rieske 2Fe-2S domain-containing protein [Pirellulales bacterium]